jgi:hypothetical protein
MSRQVQKPHMIGVQIPTKAGHNEGYSEKKQRKGKEMNKKRNTLVYH